MSGDLGHPAGVARKQDVAAYVSRFEIDMILFFHISILQVRDFFYHRIFG